MKLGKIGTSSKHGFEMIEDDHELEKQCRGSEPIHLPKNRCSLILLSFESRLEKQKQKKLVLLENQIPWSLGLQEAPTASSSIRREQNLNRYQDDQRSKPVFSIWATYDSMRGGSS